MWKIVHETQVPDFREPVLAVLAGRGEQLCSNGVENVAWKMAYHPKECELSEVKESFTRKTASQEEDNRLWCFRVQFEKLFCGFFNMLGDDIGFRFGN